jgi:hypothetical protein
VEGKRGSRADAARFRLTRRIALACAVVSLTLAGHSAAGGMLPSAAGLFMAVVLASAVTLAVTVRRRTWAWLITFLVSTQLLIHAVLVASSAHPHATGGAPSLLPSGWMAFAHVLVSAIVAFALQRGDEVLDAWASLLAASFGTRLVALGPVGSVDRSSGASDVWWSVASDRVWDASRRGPPSVPRA